MTVTSFVIHKHKLKMKKSEQQKASKHEDGVDFISNMPDPILLLILSRLQSIEEVIRTSVLSKRWNYLWTSVPIVDIYCFADGRNPGYFNKRKFREFVYWILANRSVDLDIFRLYCSNYYGMSTIRRWIRIAVTKNVKELDLSFIDKQEVVDIRCLLTCCSLKVLKLHLGGLGLILPNFKFKGLQAIRVLELSFVDFLEDGDLVKGFLQSFPMLEELILFECCIWKLDLLCVALPKVKKLSITNHENEFLCAGIKICCPKLVDLEVRGNVDYTLFFESLDSLKKVVIETESTGNTKSMLFPGISNVESLLIDIPFFCQCIDVACDPALPNLKTLVLKAKVDDFTIDELIRILKYYSKLESLKLIITKEFDGPEDWGFHEGDARKVFTSDLKRVELFEFNGEKTKVVLDWHKITSSDMVLSWGNKAQISH